MVRALKRNNTDHAESDEALVRQLVDGDAAALEELAARHARAAYGLALHMLGDPGWAEELVQEVLLRLWRQPARYDPARGSVQTWLLRITHNAAVDALRSRRGTARAMDGGADALDTLPAAGPDPFACAWDGARAEVVRRALAALPAEQREVIELAYYGGLSQAEIARRTGRPLGTIKTRLRLAFDKLREVLHDHDL
jgi:RNA polymerase sigma-70 factor (ECF subfamily)